MDGVAATHAIRREFPETLVLILTAVDESAGLSDALEAGAAGYVLKDAPAARITDAVRRTLAGESALDEGVAMGLLTRLMNGRIEEKESEQKRGAANPLPLPKSPGGCRLASGCLPYAPRGRCLEDVGPGTDQPADRPKPLHQRQRRQEARTPYQGEAGGRRPRAGGRAGNRTRPARRAKRRLGCDLLTSHARLDGPLGPGPCGPVGPQAVTLKAHENGPVGRCAGARGWSTLTYVATNGAVPCLTRLGPRLRIAGGKEDGC